MERTVRPARRAGEARPNDPFKARLQLAMNGSADPFPMLFAREGNPPMSDQSSLVKRIAVGVVLAALVAGGLYYWMVLRDDGLPAGLAVSNGRIEAVRIDVATKYPGRLAEVLVAEGEWVAAGQLLARIDASEIEAELREAEAAVRLAHRQEAEAAAELTRRQSEQALTAQELARTRTLFERGHASAETLDQRTAANRSAAAAVAAAEAAAAAAVEGIDVAEARVDRLRLTLAEHDLLAPRAGRVLYRLAEPGEVLAGGGRVVSLLDLTDVYMTIFLPTREAGRVALGAEARIVLDAAPEYVVPASVSFVAAEAQFTPKHVETVEERDRLMFRIKVQIPAELLERYAQLVKTGLPGVAYVRIAADASWPDDLAPRLPDA